VALFASTITSLGFALSTYLLADGGKMLDQMEQGDTAPLEMAIPIAAGIASLQLAHELAHFLAARKHDLRIGVPLPLPSLQLGLFGCITRLRTFPASRQVLFDFAMAGPAVAGTLSVLLFLVGVLLSAGLPTPPLIDPRDATNAATELAAAAAAAPPGTPLYPVVPSALIQSSLFLGTLADVVLPSLSTSPVVALHPLAVIGFVGAVMNALQLLPIGRLDGGRIASAVLGQSSAGLLSGTCLLLLGLSTIFGGDNPVLLTFGLLIIFLQRVPDLPAFDDVSGVNEGSKTIAAIAAVLAVLILLPCQTQALPVSTPFF